MGALTNESYRLARYAGFYKGIQSAGSAISFGVDAVGTPFINELAANFGMMGFSIPLMYYVATKVIETNYGLEEEVIVPTHIGVERLNVGSDDRNDIESKGETVATQQPLMD